MEAGIQRLIFDLAKSRDYTGMACRDYSRAGQQDERSGDKCTDYSRRPFSVDKRNGEPSLCSTFIPD